MPEVKSRKFYTQQDINADMRSKSCQSTHHDYCFMLSCKCTCHTVERERGGENNAK